MPTFDTPEPIAAVLEITAGRVQIHASDRTDMVDRGHRHAHPARPRPDLAVGRAAGVSMLR
jgi:hypothetical protein